MLRTHIVVLTVIIGLIPVNVWADSAPRLNDGKKWRIGYYEGGPFSDYGDTMRPFIQGLIEAGWIQDKMPPKHRNEPIKPYWDWLVRCNSPFLSFRAEDAYSAEWDEDTRLRVKQEVLRKLAAGQIDLMIAMGTWAGQDLANNQHSTPTMVLSTSAPIEAGIIRSAENSGLDHITARVDPGRYLRQLRLFHRIVGFKVLGIAYENTPDGKLYSAVGEALQAAEERKFEVVFCEVIDTTSDKRISDASCLSCYRKLAQSTDAIYITALTCVDRLVGEISEIFRQEKIPSFSLMGSKFVKEGILMSISNDTGYDELGKYNAMKLGKILNGTKPVELEQVFEDPLDIAINVRTAKQIGFDIPKGLLRIAAEIYE